MRARARGATLTRWRWAINRLPAPPCAPAILAAIRDPGRLRSTATIGGPAIQPVREAGRGSAQAVHGRAFPACPGARSASWSAWCGGGGPMAGRVRLAPPLARSLRPGGPGARCAAVGAPAPLAKIEPPCEGVHAPGGVCFPAARTTGIPQSCAREHRSGVVKAGAVRDSREIAPEFSDEKFRSR
jgi:hypothetical protein